MFSMKAQMGAWNVLSTLRSPYTLSPTRTRARTHARTHTYARPPTHTPVNWYDIPPFCTHTHTHTNGCKWRVPRNVLRGVQKFTNPSDGGPVSVALRLRPNLS